LRPFYQIVLFMLHSNKFQTTTFNFDDKSFKIEYDLTVTPEGSYVGFGNIYINGEDEEPTEFTFFTILGRVADYTPMNGTKEYIGAIVETVTGKKLSVDNAL
jgi:hypothetical protein